MGRRRHSPCVVGLRPSPRPPPTSTRRRGSGPRLASHGSGDGRGCRLSTRCWASPAEPDTPYTLQPAAITKPRSPGTGPRRSGAIRGERRPAAGGTASPPARTARGRRRRRRKLGESTVPEPPWPGRGSRLRGRRLPSAAEDAGQLSTTWRQMRAGAGRQVRVAASTGSLMTCSVADGHDGQVPARPAAPAARPSGRPPVDDHLRADRSRCRRRPDHRPIRDVDDTGARGDRCALAAGQLCVGGREAVGLQVAVSRAPRRRRPRPASSALDAGHTGAGRATPPPGHQPRRPRPSTRNSGSRSCVVAMRRLPSGASG